jgi:Mg-chelatase subunit ChlD
MGHSLIALVSCIFAVTVSAERPEASPAVSMGIILDTSGGMAVNMRLVRAFLTELANSAGSADEFALIQSSDRPVIVSGFSSASDLARRAEFINPRGRSALLDAVYIGSQFVQTGRNARKVLVVISNGIDNCSRYTEAEIRESLAQTRVVVFAVATSLESDEHEWALLRRLAGEPRGRLSAMSRSSNLPTLVRELTAGTRAD